MKFIKPKIKKQISPSRQSLYLGRQIAFGFINGIMKGKIENVLNKRQRYKLGWRFETNYRPLERIKFAFDIAQRNYEYEKERL